MVTTSPTTWAASATQMGRVVIVPTALVSNRTCVLAVCTRVPAGTTVLLTTQYLEEADRLADNIVVIDKGLIAAEGTATQLKARLGDTVIEFELADAAIANSAASLLGGTTSAGTVVRLVMSQGAVTLRDALNQLAAADITPVNVALREPTLDDVFLTLTGNSGVNS